MKKIFVALGIILIGLYFLYKPRYDDNSLKRMLLSDNKEDMINALLYAAKTKNTSMVKYILREPFDARISHNISHYGQSVYQVKMLAMQKLTGVESNNPVNYIPDTAVVEFYVDVAVKRGWLIKPL